MTDKNKKKDKEVEESQKSEDASEIPQEQTNKELLQCQERNEQLEGQIKRVLADYQNLEKRVREERTEWIRLANKDLLLRFLPVLDTLVLAGKHIDNQGLKLSIKQFEDVLKEEGLVKIEASGKEFDPHTMECFQTIDGEEGKVLEEIRAGYMINEKVVRPAQVKVGK